MTSNRDTSEWIATFDDALLAQSAVDRYKNNAFDLIIDGESYRPRLKPQLDQRNPPPTLPVAKVPLPPCKKSAPDKPQKCCGFDRTNIRPFT